MKNYLNSTKLSMLLFCFLAPTFVFAQACAAPVDGGLSVLAGIGIASYATKKIADKRKKK